MPRRDPQRPTLATIARALGVSTATVSYCYSRPEKVSDEVRSKVMAEARRQGYAGPDPAARQLSRGRTNTLGLLFTDQLSDAFADPAAIAFIQGLSASCQSAGLNLLLVSTESSGERSSAVDSAVVDGFVVYSVSADDPHLARILDRQLPTVVVDSPPDIKRVDWVGPDDYAGGHTLGELVTGLGHRHIGVITASPVRHFSGPTDLATIARATATAPRKRILGFADALKVAGLNDFPIEQRPLNTEEAGVDALHSILHRHPEITAVCAMMDLMALGALKAARQRGLTVPDDLTITGYDDIAEAAQAGLTTIHQPLTDKGRIAGDLYLSYRQDMHPRRRLLPLHLKVRQTSSPPNASRAGERLRIGHPSNDTDRPSSTPPAPNRHAQEVHSA